MKGIIKVSAVIAAAVLCVSAAQAMTVGLTAASWPIGDANSLGLAQGDLVELGITSHTAAQIDSAFTGGGASAVQALFTIWATDTIGDGTGADSSIAATIVSPGAGFFGAQAYMLVFNQSSVGGNVGVFAGTPFNGQTSANADSWLYPLSDSAGAKQFDTGDVNANGVVLGSIGAINDGSSVFNGSPALLLATVPEPSSIALVVLGLLGGFGLIRRRR